MLSTTGQSREQLASQMKHLHTLWRNAKLKLMEKDEELDDAKDRIKTLEKAQEGHVSKISALMTVKELSVELQTRHSFATSQLEQMRDRPIGSLGDCRYRRCGGCRLEELLVGRRG